MKASNQELPMDLILAIGAAKARIADTKAALVKSLGDEPIITGEEGLKRVELEFARAHAAVKSEIAGVAVRLALHTAAENGQLRDAVVNMTLNREAGHTPARKVKNKHRGRGKDPRLERLGVRIRQLKAEGNNQRQIVTWLENNKKDYPPPPSVAWANLGWRAAFHSKKHCGAVRSRLSALGREK